jgi:hypothetical protein
MLAGTPCTRWLEAAMNGRLNSMVKPRVQKHIKTDKGALARLAYCMFVLHCTVDEALLLLLLLLLLPISPLLLLLLLALVLPCCCFR